MYYKYGVLFICGFILFSCSPKSTTQIKSLALIGKDYKEIKENIPYSHGAKYQETADADVVSDTLIVLSYVNNAPFEGLFLFENDKCYYEKLNIYCSPCADQLVSDIMKDDNFDFVAIDNVNFISQKDSSIVLRLKEKLTDIGNCNEITIIKTGSTSASQ